VPLNSRRLTFSSGCLTLIVLPVSMSRTVTSACTFFVLSRVAASIAMVLPVAVVALNPLPCAAPRPA